MFFKMLKDSWVLGKEEKQWFMTEYFILINESDKII